MQLETPAGSLPLLRIELPAVAADELPDLADSWAWAHVQSLVGLDGAAAAVAAATGEVVARLLCPRRLLPDSCLARLRRAGLRRRRRSPAGATPSPTRRTGCRPGTSPRVVIRERLPVYHYWRFGTGREGDFETLCRRLVPDGDGVPFGLQPMDVSDPGLMAPSARRVLLDFEGALRTPGVVPRPWKDRDRAAFQSGRDEAAQQRDPAHRRAAAGPGRALRPGDAGSGRRAAAVRPVARRRGRRPGEGLGARR